MEPVSRRSGFAPPQRRSRGVYWSIFIRAFNELFLIRHATTDMAGTLCGQIDPPLNAMGREQASSLALLLRSRDVRRLYTSDLQHTVQTARPLAQLWAVPIVKRADLREISFGNWEGRRWSEVRTCVPDIRAMGS